MSDHPKAEQPSSSESLPPRLGPDLFRPHLFALDGLLDGPDDAPTTAALAQQKLLEPQYQSAIQKYKHFLENEVVAFNSKMSAHKLSGVTASELAQP